jgi:hypothetical protein
MDSEWRSLRDQGFGKYEMNREGVVRNNESKHVIKICVSSSGRRSACLYSNAVKRHTQPNIETLRKALWGDERAEEKTKPKMTTSNPKGSK